MNNIWLNKESNPKCILFFNGWGMDENSVKHVDCSGYDVCMFYDYRSLEKLDVDFSGYDEVNIIAWSMGVWAASQVIQELDINIDRAVTINGTEKPISDIYGIPEKVFNGTLSGWDNKNRIKFNIRMMGGGESYKRFSGMLSGRTLENQRSELQSIKDSIGKKNIPEIKWDRAIIGEKDMIFTAQNQKRWWDGKTGIIIKDIPHFPFGKLNSWGNILFL